MQQVAQTAAHDSYGHAQLLELKRVAPSNCLGLSFLLCSAMAEESSAEEANRLAADILFTCHILSAYIQEATRRLFRKSCSRTSSLQAT